MKRTFLALFITLAFIFTTQAQWTNNAKVLSKSDSKYIIEFSGQLDVATGTYDSLISNSFSLEDFDAEPYFTYYTNYANATSLPKVEAILKRSEDNSTFTATTITTDSLSKADSSEVPHWTAVTLGNARSSHYKLCVFQTAVKSGGTAGADNSTFTIRIIAHKRDHKF